MIKLLEILYNVEKNKGYLTYNQNKIRIRPTGKFMLSDYSLSLYPFDIHNKIIVNDKEVLRIDNIVLEYKMDESVKQFFQQKAFESLRKNKELILECLSKKNNCFFEDSYFISSLKQIENWFNSDFETNLKSLEISIKIAKGLIKKSKLNKYEEPISNCFDIFFRDVQKKYSEKLPF